MSPGRFITFEGGEGAGKSTQTARLSETLRSRGIEVVTTREPGGTEAAERIRTLLLAEDGHDWDPIAETLLHFAARREHVERLIRPAIARGAWVISDRFADSTFAYQGHAGGAPIDAIRAIAGAALRGFAPDLTIVLDVDPEVGLDRARRLSPTGDRYESRPLEFHRRLRQAFAEIARAEPQRCIVIEAGLDAEATAARVLGAVEARLPEAVR